MSEAMSYLVRSAIGNSDAEAATAWKAWRSAVDIQHLTWPEMQILPMLNGPRLEDWLAEDPAAGILKGIVRRVWSEAQMRLGMAREVASCLNQAGCGSVTLVGAIGTYLRNLQSTAIRPVLELRMLISRQDLVKAVAALECEEWQSRDPIPEGEWLDRTAYVLLNRNGNRLYLHWRLTAVPMRMAAACEREFLGEHRLVEAIGTEFRILAPGHALIEVLTDREESVDALAWQVDAAVLCRERIEWARWAAQAAPYRSQVAGRVLELRTLGVDIPALPQPKMWTRLWPLSALAETSRRTAGGWVRRFSAAMGKQ